MPTGTATDCLYNPVILFSGIDYSTTELQSYLTDYSQDIAFRRRCVWPHDKIRSGENVKVGGMVSYVESAIKKLTQLFGSAGWFNVKQVI